ncbi:hypothetical protein [Nostoc sp. CHAB 5715]|nr:hypothetical protein [Nostoc sp. CHAB 5715]
MFAAIKYKVRLRLYCTQVITVIPFKGAIKGTCDRRFFDIMPGFK